MNWQNSRIFVLTLLYRFNSAYDGKTLVRDIGAKACPYTHFCCTNASKVVADEKYEPCCSPCFCEDDCWELNNCCPDKDDILVKPSILACKESLVKKDSYLRQSRRSYRIVDNCPSSEGNRVLIGKCKGVTQTSLNDFIWVSDKSSGRIYQNAHCARCHGIDNVIGWNIKTFCKDLLYETDFASVKETLLSKSCSIENVIPAGLRSVQHKYECNDHILAYSRCTALAGGTQIGDIVEGCERSFWPFMGSFQNVFCYMCNNKDLNITTQELFKKTNEPGNTQSGLTALSLLLNYGQTTEIAAQRLKCNRDEIFDPFIDKCRKLKCPFTKTPVYGRCEQLFSMVYGLRLSAAFHLELLRNKSSLDMQNSTLVAAAIFNNLQIILGLDKTRCTLCELVLQVTDTEILLSDYVFLVTVLVSSACDIGFILGKLNSLLNARLVVTSLESGPIFIKASLDTQFHGSVYNHPLNVMSNFFNYSCENYVTMYRLESLVTCSVVTLAYSDLAEFAAAQETTKYLFLSFFDNMELVNGSAVVDVCLDDYISVMSRADASWPFHLCGNPRIMIVIFAMTLVLR